MAVESPLKVWTEREGALLRLRLARPKANIVDAAMITALQAAFDAHRGEPGVLAALIDAEGPHFSFGASVEEHLVERCAAMLASLHALLLSMIEWPQPILVAVKGQCLGGGLELAMGGSLIFAASDAKLGQPEIQLGVFAPAASCLLPPRIGQAAAEDLLGQRLRRELPQRHDDRDVLHVPALTEHVHAHDRADGRGLRFDLGQRSERLVRGLRGDLQD